MGNHSCNGIMSNRKYDKCEYHALDPNGLKRNTMVQISMTYSALSVTCFHHWNLLVGSRSISFRYFGSQPIFVLCIVSTFERCISNVTKNSSVANEYALKFRILELVSFWVYQAKLYDLEKRNAREVQKLSFYSQKVTLSSDFLEYNGNI